MPLTTQNPDCPLPVAVIDLGSNTIKLLVAARGADGGYRSLAARTLEARISAGIGSAGAPLTPEGMDRGLAAVTELLQEARTHAPARTAIVATSAVRDAANGAAFADRISRATGIPVRILGGDNEALLIGRGLTCDPALRGIPDFYVFDLGGGSLECLAFRARHPVKAVSLPLGCVRLMELFVRDPSLPLGADEARAIRTHVNETLGRSGFELGLPPGSPAVGTGGTVSTVRAIAAARAGRSFEETSPEVPVALLRSLLDETGALPLGERGKVPGLPPGRADVFPAALQTLLTLAAGGRFQSYLNSTYNLRWGVAADLLAADPLPA